MDNIAIDQILSSVNGGDDDNDMTSLMRDLQHRVPAIRHSHNEINKPRVQRPTDPVGSVSSAENVSNSDSLDEHMDEVPAHARAPQSHVPRHDTIQNVKAPAMRRTGDVSAQSSKGGKVKKSVKINTGSDMDDNGSNTPTKQTNGNDSDNNVGVATPSHLTNLFGYNIPTSTLYFIIILAIIAVALYFLTAEKKKPVRDDKDNDKKKKDAID